jgi:hypothetical protein
VPNLKTGNAVLVVLVILEVDLIVLRENVELLKEIVDQAQQVLIIPILDLLHGEVKLLLPLILHLVPGKVIIIKAAEEEEHGEILTLQLKLPEEDGVLLPNLAVEEEEDGELQPNQAVEEEEDGDLLNQVVEVVGDFKITPS